MTRYLAVSDRILEIMRGIPDCRLDDLVVNCQDSLSQVVLSEISHLSREGQLQLTLLNTGSFTVQLLNANGRSRLAKTPFNMEKTMKRDSAKPQQGRNNKKSGTARRLDSVRVAQPSSIHLTCNEAQLEALMSEGEST
ncbi:MAG: hypothetical protein SGJ26_00675 [Nitrospirota bacterium]|nr:hypothetical protein [Nitrospirota bacterium]